MPRTVGHRIAALLLLVSCRASVLGSSPPTDSAKNTGRLDKDHIRSVVRGHIEEVRACYNAGMKRAGYMHGRVTIRFTIDPNGSVTAAQIVGNELGDRKVAGCIRRVARGLEFNRPDGGGNVVVTYPFLLEAS